MCYAVQLSVEPLAVLRSEIDMVNKILREGCADLAEKTLG